MHEFYKKPGARPRSTIWEEVGGNACSILEAFVMVEAVTGKPQRWSYVWVENRAGDHICYYSDPRKIQAHYPAWSIARPLPSIFEEIAASWSRRLLNVRQASRPVSC